MDGNKSLNDYVGLYQYLDNCNNVDKRKVIYFISKHLKGLHSSGYYVPYFNLKSIMINNNDVSDVYFPSIANGQNDSELANYKWSNVYELSLISFASFLPDYSINNNGLLNANVIRENFDNFSYIFNGQDINYYRDVLVNNNFSYYSDYVDDLEKKTGNNVSNSNNRAYSYSTREGRMMTDNDAAFTSYLLLFVNVSVVGLLFMLMLFYL